MKRYLDGHSIVFMPVYEDSSAPNLPTELPEYFFRSNFVDAYIWFDVPVAIERASAL